MSDAARIQRARMRRRQWVRDQVAHRLGEEVICGRCGATWRTFSDKCLADLGETCAGSDRINSLERPLEQKVGL